MKILVSAYACSPNWGSEPGMGWNWIVSLARYCCLTVITEKGFYDDVAAALPLLNLPYPPKFHFIDIGETARERGRNQGDWRFYWDYRKWQWRAYLLAKELSEKEHFDIVHQLNMIGYREPGYLWKLDLPFVWGPIGGHAQMPWRFMKFLGPRIAAFYATRNILNSCQMWWSHRVGAAMARAKALVAATDTDWLAIRRVHGRGATIINETGTVLRDTNGRDRSNRTAGRLRVCWCGKFIGLKALPIAFYAVQSAAKIIDIELHIVGDGPENSNWRSLAEKLGLLNLCTWHGLVSHGQALDIMDKSDCLLFTSLQEGTPHVVLEALGLGTPVICHNACGHGSCVDETCGIKVPLISPQVSIEGFVTALVKLAKEPGLVSKLSQGAIDKAQKLSWDNKANKIVEIYSHIKDAPNSGEDNNTQTAIGPADTG